MVLPTFGIPMLRRRVWSNPRPNSTICSSAGLCAPSRATTSRALTPADNSQLQLTRRRRKYQALPVSNSCRPLIHLQVEDPPSALSLSVVPSTRLFRQGRNETTLENLWKPTSFTKTHTGNRKSSCMFWWISVMKLKLDSLSNHVWFNREQFLCGF